MAAVADSIPPSRRAQVIGGIMAFATLSGVIGVPLVAVAANSGGWRLSFLVIGILLAACTLLNWFWFPKNEGAGLRSLSFLSRYRLILAIPVFRAALTVNVAQRMAYIALFSYLAAYLIEAYDMSVGAIAVPLALVGIGTVVGSYIGGLLANRKDRMPLMAISSLAGGGTALLLFLIEVPVWAAVAIATGAVALLSVAWPLMITFSAEISTQSRATGVGLLGASNQSGGVGGAAMGGVLLAASGFPGVGYLCLGVTAFAAVVIVLFMRKPRP